ncbi:PAS domain-containing sensor histidine kinase [Sphaerisporangium sp. TRM90804]|uniref:sensor histidine kinase n=1 Tax=Sphaerisporangium sp. TRM90804 TaxID=3031113 RepID=UPI00244A3D86|nr:PAS domain-containing sensor histidine kinase [Sphaerisporangium sp. TRM90804]MDH2428376.1 ATP-binding protein [Sphaerisporangium sp. TRM90804]
MAGPDYAAVFQAAPAALSLLSPELVYSAANQAFERLTSRSRQEISGRYLLDVFPGGPSTSQGEALRLSMQRVLSTAAVDIMPLQRYDMEVPGRPGDVQERYWNITNAPLLDGQGQACGVVNLPQEVTAFVQQMSRRGLPVTADAALAHMAAIEAQLFAQADQLHEVNQRLRRGEARERRTVRELRMAMRHQQQALADTSHDLRGPITGLQTRLQVALADPAADARQSLLAALDDAERLGDIVGDLLELARLEACAPADAEPVDLARLVRRELHHRQATITSITTATCLDAGVLVQGSAVQLGRLVGNLLANAERHARSRLEVTVRAHGDQAVVEVTDDGPGIPHADREAVFRRFFRRSDARRSDPGGTGLGLPIARQIAQAHGGTLEAVDPAGSSHGARLLLRLPLLRS